MEDKIKEMAIRVQRSNEWAILTYLLKAKHKQTKLVAELKKKVNNSDDFLSRIDYKSQLAVESMLLDEMHRVMNFSFLDLNARPKHMTQCEELYSFFISLEE